MTEINLGGGILLITQVALLVLYYGGVYPILPWWVVWFPLLLTGSIIVLALIAFVGFRYIFAIQYRLTCCYYLRGDWTKEMWEAQSFWGCCRVEVEESTKGGEH